MQLWRHDMDRLFADKLSTRTRQGKWRGVQAVDGLTAHVCEPLLFLRLQLLSNGIRVQLRLYIRKQPAHPRSLTLNARTRCAHAHLRMQPTQAKFEKITTGRCPRQGHCRGAPFHGRQRRALRQLSAGGRHRRGHGRGCTRRAAPLPSSPAARSSSWVSAMWRIWPAPCRSCLQPRVHQLMARLSGWQHGRGLHAGPAHGRPLHSERQLCNPGVALPPARGPTGSGLLRWPVFLSIAWWRCAFERPRSFLFILP